MGMSYSTADQSMGTLLRQMADDGAHLARQEVALARIEFSETAHNIGHGTSYAVTAALLGLLTVQMLMFAIVLLMGDALFHGQWWIAAFVLTLALGAGAIVLFARAKALLSPNNIIPDQTIATLRGDTNA
jgi:hypothetical protein